MYCSHCNGSGCTYEEWKNGVAPLPVKGLYCPYLWTNQGLQIKDKNGLYKNYCNKLLVGGSITGCNRYPIMDECWNIFDGDDAYLKYLKEKGVLLQYHYNIESDEVITFEVEQSAFSKFVKDEDKLLEFVLFMNSKHKGSLYGFLKQYNKDFCEKYKLILSE